MFNTLTALSLLLLLATVGLWVDSYSYQSTAGTQGGGGWHISGMSNDQGLHSTVSIAESGSIPYQPHMRRVSNESLAPFSTHRTPTDWNLGGFGYQWNHQSRKVMFHAITAFPAARYYRLLLPHWFVTVIFTILPAIWLYKRNKRRKLGPTACQGCGYDLSGNESGSCPECGVANRTG